MTFDNRASDGFAITPDDSNDLAVDAGSIYVGVTGNIALVTVGGTTLTFLAVQAGSILAVKARRVLATGTTATNLIGLNIGG